MVIPGGGRVVVLYKKNDENVDDVGVGRWLRWRRKSVMAEKLGIFITGGIVGVIWCGGEVRSGGG